ncbi:MAG: glycosyltransferase family 4 protein [Bacteroidota bacterium]
MKIVYFYQYFSTSEGAWGTRVYEFAKRWVANGHEVTVVSSIYSKSDITSSRLVSDQLIDGIRVKVINVRIDNRQPVWKRVYTFLAYACLSTWFALTLKADVVIASSGPITVGIPGLVARWFRGRKLVFEARDLWPEGAIRMKIITNPLLVHLSYAFEKICYRSSDYVVGLSPGIQQNIQQRFPGCRVASVTNAANIALFSEQKVHKAVWPAHSYAVYFGNIGAVNHSGYLLDTAALLLAMNRPDITVVLIGEGQQKEALMARKQKENLSNVVFLDLMPKTALIGYVQQALASVVPLKPIPVFDTSSPNKLFESMAAGVPVIQTTQGWIKDFLHEHGAGITVDGTKPRQLAEALIQLKDDASLRAAMGLRAAEVARQFFDKDYLADKMLRILTSVHDE